MPRRASGDEVVILLLLRFLNMSAFCAAVGPAKREMWMTVSGWVACPGFPRAAYQWFGRSLVLVTLMDLLWGRLLILVR